MTTIDESLIENLANAITDAADQKALVALYYDNTYGYLEGLSGEELLVLAEDYGLVD